MDVHLTYEAYHSLQAVVIGGAPGRPDGFLLGHERGHRFIIEKIFPTRRGFFPSLDVYNRLNRHFEDRILGFFAFQPTPGRKAKILTPFACGKIFLEIKSPQWDPLNIRSFLIDYEGKFLLRAIPLYIEGKET